MDKLQMVENELVPVYVTSTGEKVVNGRELYSVLKSRQDFSTWVKKRLLDCDAVENEDYDRFHKKMEANNATMIDYIIKLDTAKEMAMLERNEKGKEVRRYFIQVEKKYKEQTQQASRTMTVQELIQLLAQGTVELEGKINAVDKDLQEFKRDMPILGMEADQITEAVHDTCVAVCGGVNSNAYKDRSLRGKVYSDIYREFKMIFGVTSYKALRRNQRDMAVGLVRNYKAPAHLASQIRFTNAQFTLRV